MGVRVMAARWFTLVATTETSNWKRTPLIQQIGRGGYGGGVGGGGVSLWGNRDFFIFMWDTALISAK